MFAHKRQTDRQTQKIEKDEDVDCQTLIISDVIRYVVDSRV